MFAILGPLWLALQGMREIVQRTAAGLHRLTASLHNGDTGPKPERLPRIDRSAFLRLPLGALGYFIIVRLAVWLHGWGGAALVAVLFALAVWREYREAARRDAEPRATMLARIAKGLRRP